ncbi:hypothetical protein V2S84_27740, partial [Azotobacter chroococcum]|nr:hypothetical protein [Azotobacter chroococcum]
MFLLEVRITNFRKFGQGTNGEPGLVLVLNKGLNVLIGENDAGKRILYYTPDTYYDRQSSRETVKQIR